MATLDPSNGQPTVEEFKVFVGGIAWQMDDKALREVFRKFGATDAVIMIDKHTMRSRGFGFVTFEDKKGMEEAIEIMHNKELEGRTISVTRAIPQDQTLPGTPAAALGGGRDSRGRGYDRPPERDGRGYERGYHRYADRYPYERAGVYERSYDRYAEYDRAAYAGYGAPYRDIYGREAYPRPAYDERAYPAYDQYGRAGYAATYDPAYAAGYARPYERLEDSRYRGPPGADRFRGYVARPTPYDRAPRPREAR